MEIKAELLKPYTEKERMAFVVEQNHKLGYEIRETEIDEKVKELYNMATVEMIKNNKENVDTYCSIINSLIECKS